MTVCVRFGKTVTEYSGSDTIELISKGDRLSLSPFLFPQVSAIVFFLLCEDSLHDGISAKNYKLKH